MDYSVINRYRNGLRVDETSMMRIGILAQEKNEQENVFATIAAKAGFEAILIKSASDLLEVDGLVLSGADLRPDVYRESFLQNLRILNERGKPILGMNAYAGLLAEMGLVPGLENNKPAVQLKSSQASLSQPLFVKLSKDYQRNAFTNNILPKDLYAVHPIPSCFSMSKVLYDEIMHQGLNVWLYCNQLGDVLDDGMEYVAGLSNKRGNVLAFVPTFLDKEKNLMLLTSMRDYLQKGLFQDVAPLNYYPR